MESRSAERRAGKNFFQKRRREVVKYAGKRRWTVGKAKRDGAVGRSVGRAAVVAETRFYLRLERALEVFARGVGDNFGE